jgi:Lon protease-like protein
MVVEISIPDTVPVMTLPNVAFFPGVVMPLHIFEPRYRLMLRDTLQSHRLFAVAGLDARGAAFETPHRVATVGVVRACQDADNGTSNLLLHGISRVQVQEIVREQPYRLIRVRALSSTLEGSQIDIANLRSRIASLLAAKRRLGATVPSDLVHCLAEMRDADAFVDLASFTFCDDTRVKQTLLETLSVRERLEILLDQIEGDVAELRLRRRLQGKLGDEEVGVN